jgi:hypothetical protein
MMWSHLPLRSLIDMQRRQAIQDAGAEIAQLHADGYDADADRLLDELHVRIESWKREAGVS